MRTKILFGALLLSVALCSRGFSQCCAGTGLCAKPACCEKACGCERPAASGSRQYAICLRSERPVCLQALRCVRDLRPREGLLRPGTGLLCQARLLRDGLRLLLCQARLLCAPACRPAARRLAAARNCCAATSVRRLLRDGLPAAEPRLLCQAGLPARRLAAARPAAAARRSAAAILWLIWSATSSP